MHSSRTSPVTTLSSHGQIPLSTAPQQGNWRRGTARTPRSLPPHQPGARSAISPGHRTPAPRGASAAASASSPVGMVCAAMSTRSSQRNSEGLSAKSIPALWWKIKARRGLRSAISGLKSTKKSCGEASAIHRARADVTCSR